VPVIAMTANNVIGARDMYLQQGFAEYLLKPVDPELLEELVERFLPAALIEKEGAVSTEDSSPLPKIEGIET
jgi:CheY-like chemotaxis protein